MESADRAGLDTDGRKHFLALGEGYREWKESWLYEYPSEHWLHLRTSNVIESPFAAVRLRTDAAERFRTVKSGVHLIWQLLLKQEKNWLWFCVTGKYAGVPLPE